MNSKLTRARLELFFNLHELVDRAAERAFNFYEKEAGCVGLLWRDRTWHPGNVSGVSYTGDGVNVEWEEYHRNCRTDGGSFTVPWEALADDTYVEYITSLVASQVAKVRDEAAAARVSELEYKRRKLEELKRELGEA